MKKDVLLIAHFCSDFDEKGNNRFNYLADLLSRNECNVELATTDFSHLQKARRNVVHNLLNFHVTMIHEPGYNKNISFKRFYSHYIMGRNLKKYLKIRKKPDIIYCAVPSLDVAKVASVYARRNNIPFMIDVQDLWPEAFKMVFNVPVISDILFYPMRRQADYIYAAADQIIAVSHTYADRAIKVNNKCKETHSIFLGTKLEFFDKLAKGNKVMNKPQNETWLAYAGTLGHSYDLTCVIDALRILKDKGINNIKFIVMGDGPLRVKFENYAKAQGVNVEFTGLLDYGKMVGILAACDMAVNPIRRGAAQSIINKHGDYAAAGLPVINTQECAEYRRLIDQYECGINCSPDNAEDVSNAIEYIIYNFEKAIKMGSNSRRLAEEKFDRANTYKEVLDLLRKFTIRYMANSISAVKEIGQDS